MKRKRKKKKKKKISLMEKLKRENEEVWGRIAQVAVELEDEEKTVHSFERVLFYNEKNVKALKKISEFYIEKNQYIQGIEYLNRLLSLNYEVVDTLSCLGHCYLQMDDLEKSYQAYQQSLYKAKIGKSQLFDSKTWYGIGILYERYGDFDGAEECFKSIIRKDKEFKKTTELFFRLCIIYKVKKQYDNAIGCLTHILQTKDFPQPLTESDIIYQIGNVYEISKNFKKAFQFYEKAFQHDELHVKSLRQMAYLFLREDCTMYNDVEKGIEYLRKATKIKPSDSFTWYLLGRCFMQEKKYKDAFDAYRQSVFRDQRNPTYWCSIGVLYYKINQRQDALDAYSKAIKLNDQMYQVWYNLGTLYESCGQREDALDAYQKGNDICPSDPNLKHKLLALSKGSMYGNVAASGHRQPLLPHIMSTNRQQQQQQLQQQQPQQQQQQSNLNLYQQQQEMLFQKGIPITNQNYQMMKGGYGGFPVNSMGNIGGNIGGNMGNNMGRMPQQHIPRHQMMQQGRKRQSTTGMFAGQPPMKKQKFFNK